MFGNELLSHHAVRTNHSLLQRSVAAKIVLTPDGAFAVPQAPLALPVAQDATYTPAAAVDVPAAPSSPPLVSPAVTVTSLLPLTVSDPITSQTSPASLVTSASPTYESSLALSSASPLELSSTVVPASVSTVIASDSSSPSSSSSAVVVAATSSASPQPVGATAHHHGAAFYVLILVGSFIGVGLLSAVIAWYIRLRSHKRRQSLESTSDLNWNDGAELDVEKGRTYSDERFHLPDAENPSGTGGGIGLGLNDVMIDPHRDQGILPMPAFPPAPPPAALPFSDTRTRPLTTPFGDSAQVIEGGGNRHPPRIFQTASSPAAGTLPPDSPDPRSLGIANYMPGDISSACTSAVNSPTPDPLSSRRGQRHESKIPWAQRMRAAKANDAGLYRELHDDESLHKVGAEGWGSSVVSNLYGAINAAFMSANGAGNSIPANSSVQDHLTRPPLRRVSQSNGRPAWVNYVGGDRIGDTPPLERQSSVVSIGAQTVECEEGVHIICPVTPCLGRPPFRQPSIKSSLAYMESSSSAEYPSSQCTRSRRSSQASLIPQIPAVQEGVPLSDDSDLARHLEAYYYGAPLSRESSVYSCASTDDWKIRQPGSPKHEIRMLDSIEEYEDLGR